MLRDYKMDNIKFFLIVCVVIGHMLEAFYGGRVYKVIYSFHMPAFMFVSGYFARFDKKKIVSSLIYPYILFQSLYLVYDAAVINQDLATLKFQYTTPFWLLWFLMALAFYHLLIPFMQGTKPVFLMIVGCALSLIMGFDQSIGYYLSLARFFTFLPYFILGMVWKQLNLQILINNCIFRLLNVICVLVTCYFLGKYTYISSAMLWGSNSYVSAQYTILIKGMLLLCGINWILFFMWIFPKFKIPVASSIGKNTLTIYLLHGFIKRYLVNLKGIFIYSRNVNIGLAVLISFLIVLLFGNKYIGSLGKLIFTGEGIGKIIGYMRTGKMNKYNYESKNFD